MLCNSMSQDIRKRALCTIITNYDDLSVPTLISILIVVAKKTLANVHNVLDLSLQLACLENADGVVESDVTSSLVGVIEVDEGA